MERDSEWILVENLKEKEIYFKEKDLDNFNELDKHNDFGSYRWVLLKGLHNSMIECHNTIGKQSAWYVKMLSDIITKYFQ